MSDLLDPKNDFVFKRLFGSEEHKEILLAFLNRVMARNGEPPLAEIVLLNPYTDKDAPHDKLSIFDIHAKAEDGKLIIVEMQLFNKYDNERRALYYWSKLYAGQLEEGQSYKRLRKCVTVLIVDFALVPTERYHHLFRLREDDTGIPLTEDIEIHILELSKLNAPPPGEGGLLNWLLFLKNEDPYDWEALKMNEPMLGKAMSALEYLSQDAEARRLYEMRQKALHDEASMLEGAREEGEQTGERKSKLEVARNLLRMGMDIPTIAEATGLPPARIEELRT